MLEVQTSSIYFKDKKTMPFVRFARASVDISVAPQCEWVN